MAFAQGAQRNADECASATVGQGGSIATLKVCHLLELRVYLSNSAFAI